MEERPDMPKLDESGTAELLRAHGITPTPQRIEIAAILLARPQHLPADEILQRVNAGAQAVSKATVYNTLALFAAHGLVREVIVDPAKVFYDSNPGPHHHFYDCDTGRLTDIEEHEIAFSRVPSPPEGMRLDRVDVIVRVKGGSG